MKVAIVHHSLNIVGGAERLCLAAIESLVDRGHDVSLVTVEKTEWNTVQRNVGQVVKPDKEKFVFSTRLSGRLSDIPTSSLYFSIFVLQLLMETSKKEHDLVINTFGDPVNSVADATYVHFPLRAALAVSQIPAFTRQKVWAAMSPAYTLAMGLVDKVVPGTILTNSKFTRDIIRKTIHKDSFILYPPVNTGVFAANCRRNEKEGQTAVVVASYTPKRHLEQVPLIARYSKDANFLIVGKADEYSSPTIKSLKQAIHRLGVEDRVTMMYNVPFAQFLRVLAKAKVYLHVMPNDHFGISVVEAMASGCVPVAHRSGGPWMDILRQEQGTFGFSYETVIEAASHIDKIIADEDLRSKVALRASHRAREFDKTVFMQRMGRVVEKLAE